tara:strand:+ start:4473 stop:5018 length:546 start_codon:yes stop_codon:yes gene_type:complete
METTKHQEDMIKKIEVLSFLVAMTDGISEEEGQMLEYVAGRIRMYYQAQPAVEEYEKSKDVEKAIALVELPLSVSINMFEPKDHIDSLTKELNEMNPKESDNPLEDFETLLKIKASEITNDYDRKVAMLAIEDVYSADESSNIERWAHLVIGKEWGVSITAVNKWANENLMPILERGNKFE